jgi:integrase
MPLPRGLYRHRRQFRARRSREHPWVYFGTDYAEAMKGFAAWKASGGERDTVSWLLDTFTGVVCPARVKAETLAPRTASDYSKDAEALKAGLGRFRIAQLEPKHVAEYRDVRAEGAPSHVRNELAALSAAMSYAVERGLVARNPCQEVKRPSRKCRERLISHDEYLAVHAKAVDSVKRAMVLAVRTLAQPTDVLAMGPRNIIRQPDGKRLLRFSRGKTGVWVEVEVVGELAQAIDAAVAENPTWPTFVHREDGGAYTVDGIGAMFRRYCAAGKGNVTDFGLRDLRAKGATDMYRAGIPIRTIQKLLGHKSVQTTEIYLKSLIPETVRPNEVAIVASVK